MCPHPALHVVPTRTGGLLGVRCEPDAVPVLGGWLQGRSNLRTEKIEIIEQLMGMRAPSTEPPAGGGQ